MEKTTSVEMKNQLVRDGIVELVPGGMGTVDAVMASLKIAMVDSPRLKNCLDSDVGRLSLYNAMRKAVRVGYSLNPQEGLAAIIPYHRKKENVTTANYQIMKNGMVKAALESGQVDAVDVEVIRENDRFEISKSDTGDHYSFSPALKDRGDVIGYSAFIKLKNGTSSIKYMTAEEVTEHRKLHSKDSAMPVIGYGKKTVLKACLRDLSLPETNQVIGFDAEEQLEIQYEAVGETKPVAEEMKERLEIGVPEPEPAAEEKKAIF